MRIVLAALIGGALAGFPSSAGARIWHVPAEAPTIQAGITAATAGDTVLVSCGTYREFEIVMKPGLVLRSETGLPECVIIDAERHGRVLLCENADDTAVIEGLTLTRGLATGAAPLDRGGGLYCVNATPRVIACMFLDNQSTYVGGGVFCRGDAYFEACWFVGNNGPPWGGGFFCWQSSPTLVNCVFMGNRAFWGAGLYCYQGGDAYLSGCVFEANDAAFPMMFGGGLACVGASSPTLERTIIAHSVAGEAIYCDDEASRPTLLCCDVFGNAGGDWIGCIAGQLGENGNFSAEPMFCAPEVRDLTLDGHSPCLPGQHPDHSDCGLIGAFGYGCGEPIATEPATWGRVKARFR
jgi:hypothetical protein